MSYIEIENRSGRLSLNDAVTPSSINRVIEEMNKLYGAKAVMENCMIGEVMCSASDSLEIVDIHIHSGGGSVLDGHRLFHAIGEMRGRGVKVIATINTLAASMGSVIAMAADEVHIVKGGRMMIHEASQAVQGTAEDHARAAKLLEEISAEIAGIYADKSGKSVDEVRVLMKKETWMGADEAVAMGFADKVISPGSVDTSKSETSKNQMGLFNKSDSASAVIALESENAELRSQFDVLKSAAAESAQRVIGLRAEVDSLSKEVAEITSAKAEVETSNTMLTADLATANAALVTAQAEVAAIPDKAEALAQAKFAGLGGPPVEASKHDDKDTKANLSGLTGHAKASAYFANQKKS